jgi:hypothetical protein
MAIKVEKLTKTPKVRMARKPNKKNKIEKVLHEFKEKELHIGSKKGPIVKSKKQAVAIALNEQRAEDKKSNKPSKKK